MSEIMRPIPFPDLINWVRAEYKNHLTVFGIREEKFFRSQNYAPIGPAAGPHSQLAQNILAAYLAGSRFIELKTVQEMDGEELRKAVARPCINALDEGYNVEWSTELTVAEAQEEYIKAWFLCHIFAKEFGIAENCDFIFNMSVGYSLDGIKSPKIDSYIEGMKNARQTEAWKQCCEYIASNMALNDLDELSPVISKSITLSTLHGCPREEIEKIAEYLISKKALHTYIKCNPTLLGYEKARSLLDEMGYTYVSFDDHHFKNDLQFDAAVEMLRRLKNKAEERGLGFGVKLTNTFPVQIRRKELPGEEMYMSGRALFPLSINVAKKLSEAFDGKLPISYSGGADYFNLKEILKTGISPVTVATTLLKPGGYERLTQLAEIGSEEFSRKEREGRKDAEEKNKEIIDGRALTALCESLPTKKRYRKEYRRTGNREQVTDNREGGTIPIFNCFKAACVGNGSAEDDGSFGCPINQRIPDYLAAVAEGNYNRAFAIIARDNTAPSITGNICDHQCQNECTRVDYEDPLQIRQAKLIAAENAQEAFIDSIVSPGILAADTAAIIGAGPAGIAAALFLRRNGVKVTVYEKRDKAFGIVQYVIPSFRISDKAIDRDFRMAQKYGVDFRFNWDANYSVADLQKSHRFVIIATGAWKEGAPLVKQGQEKIIDAIRFLEESKKSGCSLELGKRVAVIGGGNVAMDCARAAKRNSGVESVTIVYRRSREFMPSIYEEQELALADGVEFMELLAPESFSDGILRCELMRLGDYDSSCRRGIEGTGEKRELPFDTVIGAVGARVDAEPFTRNGIALNDKGLPQVNAACESSVPGVYIAGDCKGGMATVVRAIADAKAAATDILKKLGLEADFPVETQRYGTTAPLPLRDNLQELYLKKGIIIEAAADSSDAFRCLSCHSLCEICVDVCPNRANAVIEITGEDFRQPHQIVHVDRLCNECGNCAVFCPHAGKPYRDKFTLFCCEEDFSESENPGFLKTAEGYKLRLEDKSIVNYRMGDKTIPVSWIAMLETIEANYGYLIF